MASTQIETWSTSLNARDILSKIQSQLEANNSSASAHKQSGWESMMPLMMMQMQQQMQTQMQQQMQSSERMEKMFMLQMGGWWQNGEVARELFSGKHAADEMAESDIAEFS
jgi:hypothetical protein